MPRRDDIQIVHPEAPVKHRAIKRHKSRATNHKADRPAGRRGRRLAAVVAALTVAAAAPATAYKIRAGDTLGGIASRHHTTASCLARANHITDPDQIYAGHRLRIGHCGRHDTGRARTVSRSSSRLDGGPIPTAGQWHAHTGYGHPAWDITIPGQGDCGDPVRSSRDGVAHTFYWNYSYGDHVEVADTLYGHLSAILVGNGQRVSRGQVIGRVGETGNAYGCHLHYETGR